FLHLAVSRGLRGVYGVFYVSFLEAFGWTRATTAGAISLSVVFEGLSFPVVGSLTDRLGPRRTLSLGGVVLVLGIGLSATISSLWELYLWLGIVTAAGMGMIGMVPHVSVLSREFSERRGTVLGFAYAGGGFGILLMVPLAQVMISLWGWPFAYIGLAVITAFLVIPPTLIFPLRPLTIRLRPQRRQTSKRCRKNRRIGRSVKPLELPHSGCSSAPVSWRAWAIRSS
ncbi:MAG: MFS transporter, partial [Candidatus Binatia bacterium]|nr:MFS transporter [Candidatus Binatia bacterium]